MKRFVCFLLALILVLGLIPNTAVTANAASNRTVSDKAINVLKEYTSFTANPYQVGSNWYIGYGTKIDGVTTEAQAKAKYPDGIEKADALALLKTYIINTANKSVNNMASKLNLDLSQNQHDALVVFTYSNGSAWTTNTGDALYQAVRTGKTGDAFLNVITSPAYVGVTVENTEGFKAAMNRRMSEANMYNNNSYGYNAPGNYTYVVLDMDGDEVVESTDSYKVYNTTSGTQITKNDYTGSNTLLGWYVFDGKDDGVIEGQAITALNANTSRKTLVAKQGAANTNIDAKYTIKSNSLVSRYIFHTAMNRAELETYKNSMDEKKKDTLKSGTDFKVSLEKMVDGVKWVYGSGTNEKDQAVVGWAYMGELAESGTSTNKIVATAKAKTDINIRPGATQGSGDPLGTLPSGTTVNVYEIKMEPTETGNQQWGKITYSGITGWINLAYATVNDYAGATDTPDGRTGKIINAEEVNVRKTPGVAANNLITSLKKGTSVTVLETQMVGDAQWGKVRWSGLKDGYTEGWVYMYYVEVKGLEHSNPDGSTGSKPETVIYTGIVTSNINLNVRSYADVYAPKVTSLPTGTKVNVYETTEFRNMEWGRIGADQWVCLTYLKLTKVDAPSGGSNSTETTTALQGTVTSTTLDILKNYNSNAAKVGSLKKGDVVTILEKNTEKTETGSRIWGRISKDGVAGWINLAYVDLKTVTSVNGNTSSGNTTTSTTGVASVISNCLSVNVRESAGVYSTQLTKLKNGTAVTVYEEITYDGAPWARIKWNNGADEGWVCMYYVTKNVVSGNAGTTPEGGTVAGTSSNAISATGYVNNHFLNVRSGAGLGYAQLGTLAQGAKVVVYEQVVADGLIWGKIIYNNAPAYVCMSYITVENTSSTGKGVMGTIARCFAKVNVRSAPGTNNALVATINVGSRVEVFETRSHAGQLWGRVAQGWVCMDYVLLDSELPEGTILDATQPTTAATEATSATEATVNKDGEIAFIIEAQIKQELNVRNDTSTKSDRVGTINAGMLVDIKAVKNNGAELWGRIDQYATAGWILMDKENVQYILTRYVAVDEQPIYVDASTGSTVKGTLPVNQKLIINKVTTDGTNVYGWVEEGIYGWIPMSKTSETPVEVIKVFKSGETAGDSSAPVLSGKTFAAMDGVDSIGGSRVLFKMESGVNVYVNSVKFENGRIWGYVRFEPVNFTSDSGNYGYAWIDLSKVNYSVAGQVVNTTELNVRSSMDSASTTNIITTLTQGTNVQVCQFAFDGNGNIWARLNGNFGLDPERETNGAFVMVRTASNAGASTVYVQTAITP